jgi:hypothetical protein
MVGSLTSAYLSYRFQAPTACIAVNIAKLPELLRKRPRGERRDRSETGVRGMGRPGKPRRSVDRRHYRIYLR